MKKFNIFIFESSKAIASSNSNKISINKNFSREFKKSLSIFIHRKCSKVSRKLREIIRLCRRSIDIDCNDLNFEKELNTLFN